MNQRFETRAIHAGCEPDPGTGAIMTPIFQTSTYVQESPGKHKGYDYSRTHNPTRTALEKILPLSKKGSMGLPSHPECPLSQQLPKCSMQVIISYAVTMSTAGRFGYLIKY